MAKSGQQPTSETLKPRQLTEVAGPVVGKPEPCANAFGTSAGRHASGNVKRGRALLHTILLYGEDGQIVHCHLVIKRQVVRLSGASRDQ